jgi:hypothetical protein
MSQRVVPECHHYRRYRQKQEIAHHYVTTRYTQSDVVLRFAACTEVFVVLVASQHQKYLHLLPQLAEQKTSVEQQNGRVDDLIERNSPCDGEVGHQQISQHLCIVKSLLVSDDRVLLNLWFFFLLTRNITTTTGLRVCS